MANDTFLKQFQKAANDNNLIGLGCFRIQVYDKTYTANTGIYLNYKGTKAFTVKVVGGANMIAASTSDLQNNPTNAVEIPANTQKRVYCNVGNYELEVSEKYTLNMLSNASRSINTLFGYNIDDLKYSPITFARIQGQLRTGNIAYLSSIEQIYLFDTKITGDIACFNGRAIKGADSDGVTLVLARTPIYGDISNLASMADVVTELNINTTDITGTLESLVSGMSRTTGTLAVTCNGKVTLDGTAVANNTVKTYNFQTSEWS